MSVQYCTIHYEELPTYYYPLLCEKQQEQPPVIFNLQKTQSYNILQPIYQQSYDQMEIEKEEEIIEQLIIQQQPSQDNITNQIEIEAYFNKINSKLLRQHMLNNNLRNRYLDIFEKDSIQRKQCSSLDMLLNLFKGSYKEFMNTQIADIGIIKIFIEDNIDAFITGSLFPPQQLWHDYKIVVFAIILKIMRVRSTTGQLIYESMLSYLYSKLGCLFKNEPPAIPEYKDYFEWYFWGERNKQMVAPELTEDDKKSIRIVSIIRKLSCLLWSMLWIDPNYVLHLHPTTDQFRQKENIPAYRYLNQDRQLFSILVMKFIKCNTFAFLPALSSLYDIVQDKKVLLPIFKKFESRLGDEEHIKQLLEPLGPFKDEAIKEFFQYPQVCDEGLVGIVQGKLKLLKGEGQCRTETDFYEKLFSNEQRSTFYSD